MVHESLIVKCPFGCNAIMRAESTRKHIEGEDGQLYTLRYRKCVECGRSATYILNENDTKSKEKFYAEIPTRHKSKVGTHKQIKLKLKLNLKGGYNYESKEQGR